MAFQTIDDLVRENRRMIQDKGTDRAYIEAVRRWSREVGMPDTPLIDANETDRA